MMEITIPDQFYMARQSKLHALDAECVRREKDSFVFEGKTVRATAKDYLALAEFAHLISAGEENWNAQRIWINDPPYDAVPLPTAAVAQSFMIAMLEHKETFFVARSILKAQLAASPDIEALNAINVISDAQWPVASG